MSTEVGECFSYVLIGGNEVHEETGCVGSAGTAIVRADTCTALVSTEPGECFSYALIGGNEVHEETGCVGSANLWGQVVEKTAIVHEGKIKRVRRQLQRPRKR